MHPVSLLLLEEMLFCCAFGFVLYGFIPKGCSPGKSTVHMDLFHLDLGEIHKTQGDFFGCGIWKGLVHENGRRALLFGSK